MILALAATQLEMLPFLQQWPGAAPPCYTLVTGVGLLETAVRLSRFLDNPDPAVHAVVQFGIGGVYIQPDGNPQPALLDICLAEQEILGDLGICLRDGIACLDPALTGDLVFPLDPELLQRGREILQGSGVSSFTGRFITVNAATASRRRGTMLQERWRGLCENMEGAAVARVCREFAIPCLELRAISNTVDDRNTTTWRLAEACLRAGQGAAQIVKGMR